MGGSEASDNNTAKTPQKKSVRNDTLVTAEILSPTEDTFSRSVSSPISSIASLEKESNELDHMLPPLHYLPEERAFLYPDSFNEGFGYDKKYVTKRHTDLYERTPHSTRHRRKVRSSSRSGGLNTETSLMSITKLCNSNEDGEKVSAEEKDAEQEQSDSFAVGNKPSKIALGKLPEYEIAAPRPMPAGMSAVSGFYFSDMSDSDSQTSSQGALSTDMAAGSSQFIPAPDHFISRVSNIPIVNSALRFYEQSKASSKVVKYSAETVENLCKPVLNKLEPRLGPFLDEFGCRQLDSLGRRYPSLMGQSSSPSSDDEVNRDMDFEDSEIHAKSMEDERFMVVATDFHSALDTRDSWDSPHDLRKRKNIHKHSREEQDTNSEDNCKDQEATRNMVSLATQSITPRSRWEQYLVEASTAAGAGAAAFSEESMKALKYCLQWLQYATINIDRQISLLRQFLVNAANSSNPSSTAVTVNTNSALSHIKREVIETLRKVVDVVQRYAGACLPGEARRRVRNFILNLPWRWASLNSQSVSTSPISSPLLTPTSPHSGPHPNINESAQMVLTFATESLIMLQSVVGIFKDTVERAEGWIERLRNIGVGSSTEGSDEDVYMLDPPNGLYISSTNHDVQGLSDMEMD